MKKIPQVKKLIKDQDIAIILETGVNEHQRLLDLVEDLNIAKDNKMKKIEKNW